IVSPILMSRISEGTACGTRKVCGQAHSTPSATSPYGSAASGFMLLSCASSAMEARWTGSVSRGFPRHAVFVTSVMSGALQDAREGARELVGLDRLLEDGIDPGGERPLAHHGSDVAADQHDGQGAAGAAGGHGGGGPRQHP